MLLPLFPYSAQALFRFYAFFINAPPAGFDTKPIILCITPLQYQRKILNLLLLFYINHAFVLLCCTYFRLVYGKRLNLVSFSNFFFSLGIRLPMLISTVFCPRLHKLTPVRLPGAVFCFNSKTARVHRAAVNKKAVSAFLIFLYSFASGFAQ